VSAATLTPATAPSGAATEPMNCGSSAERIAGRSSANARFTRSNEEERRYEGKRGHRDARV
jgi:hypothetical protein